MENRSYVQYGSGPSVPDSDGWRHFDASPTLFFERLPLIGRLYTRNEVRFSDRVEFGDIVKGLPVDPQSLDGVYCSHVLEHLALADCRIALRNTYGLLKPGGIFRLVLPDLNHLARRYVNNPSHDAAIEFVRDSGLGLETRDRGLWRFFVSWLENSRHLWAWDFEALETELEREGFVGIRRAAIGDSLNPMFVQVEDPGRWENCLGMECRRQP